MKKRLEGNWVYTHTTPDGMVYVGMSGCALASHRWIKGHYKENSVFGKEIGLWGWDSIRHEVVAEGLTREEAKLLEGELIDFCSLNGVRLNEHRSGGMSERNGYYMENKRRLNEWYRYNYNHKKVVEESEKNDIPLF